jgi:hypothetical protein
VVAPGTGRPATPPAAAGIRLHSIGEDAAGEASTGSSPEAADAACSPSGNLQVRVRGPAAAASANHEDAADATPPSGDADTFVASLDSAFERWSMGGAAMPLQQAADQQQTGGGGGSSVLQGAQGGGEGRMLRARSAPEAAIVEASPPLSPSARQLARALQAARQRQAAHPEQGGWPSRHGSVTGGSATFAAPPSPLGRRNSLDAGESAPQLGAQMSRLSSSREMSSCGRPQRLLECTVHDKLMRRMTDQPASCGVHSCAVSSGDMTLREAEAALAAERERAARLGAMLAARQQAAEERLAALERRVACLLGNPEALAACTAAELEALEQVCTAWTACSMQELLLHDVFHCRGLQSGGSCCH